MKKYSPIWAPGVDVHAGDAMGVLAHDAGNEGHVGLVELVGYAIDEDGIEAGIGEYDLLLGLCRWVAVKGRLYVLEQKSLYRGKAVEEIGTDLARLLVHGVFGQVLVAEEERLAHLLAQGVFDARERVTDEVLGAGLAGNLPAKIAGEHDASHVIENLDDALLVGKVPILLGEEDFLGIVVVLLEIFDDVVKFTVKNGLAPCPLETLVAHDTNNRAPMFAAFRFCQLFMGFVSAYEAVGAKAML